MLLAGVYQFAPPFLLALFRVAGMMVFAPLFGSVKIPKRVRALLAVILAFGLIPVVRVPAELPASSWALAVAIGGELVFGLVIGTIMSLVFMAAQWAGEMMGQQLGFSLGEVFDPSFGGGGSLVGDLYFMLTLVVFLCVGGHHALLRGLASSFDTLPPLSVGMDATLLASVAGVMQSAAVLAFQLAAPMLVTMLVVDMVLGFLGKTIPQLNIMTAGLSVKSVIGMLVLIFGLVLTNDVMKSAVFDSMSTVTRAWGGAR